jgi:hypothetical protein
LCSAVPSFPHPALSPFPGFESHLWGNEVPIPTLPLSTDLQVHSTVCYRFCSVAFVVLLQWCTTCSGRISKVVNFAMLKVYLCVDESSYSLKYLGHIIPVINWITILEFKARYQRTVRSVPSAFSV